MTLLQTYVYPPATCTIICHFSHTLTCKQAACTHGCYKISFFFCLSNNMMSCLRRLCCQLPWSWSLLNEPKTTWFCYIVSEQWNSSCLLSWLLLVSLYERHLKRCMWIWVCVFCMWSSSVFCVLTYFATVKSIVYKVLFCIVNSHILILTRIYIHVDHNFKLATFVCYQHTLCALVGIV